MTKSMIIAAEDAADLQVISAQLQDAVARLGDFVWLPKKHRFAAMLNRFKWEDGKGHDLRVRTGLHFDGVLSVQSQNLKQNDPDAVVSLLAIEFMPRTPDDCSGTIELLFAGGGAIRLDVECIDAALSDVSEPWVARGRPQHETGR
jgi:hypothetical protein